MAPPRFAGFPCCVLGGRVDWRLDQQKLTPWVKRLKGWELQGGVEGTQVST